MVSIMLSNCNCIGIWKGNGKYSVEQLQLHVDIVSIREDNGKY